MQTVEVKTPWLVGGKPVKTIEIQPLMFTAHVALADATATALTAGGSFDSAFRSARIIAQSDLVFADSTRGKLEHVTLMSMPFLLSKEVNKALDSSNVAAVGKVISEKANGIDTPIIYQLGTPIISGSEGKEILELEFMVSTYGDVEQVMGESGSFQQTVALIKHVARPAGDTTLLTLPSWAVDQITVPDGIAMVTSVLPNFFD